MSGAHRSSTPAGPADRGGRRRRVLMTSGVLLGTLMLAMAGVLISGALTTTRMDAVEWPGDETRTPTTSAPAVMESRPTASAKPRHTDSATPAVRATPARRRTATPTPTRSRTPAERSQDPITRQSSRPPVSTTAKAPTPAPSTTAPPTTEAEKTPPGKTRQPPGQPTDKTRGPKN
ncbi:hypothetical protein [Nonomuraea sp. SYSU D8015]|uniref:hypothetical protein n=1 Tax=Nonomuraea sp. SYSU D8015 TaxID=2593644 RepID=UPI0016604508|nr:hypothetical protein [Nonomuraea sp. SYSU D8015]